MLQQTIDRDDYNTEQDVSENLLCRICLMFAIDALECKHCESIYCQQCVNDWKRAKNECPNRCTGEFETKQPHKIIKAQISALKFNCRNKNYGCLELIEYEKIQFHKSQCRYITKNCVEQCGWKGLETDLQTHKELCQFVKFLECINCGLEVVKEEIKQHSCLRALIQEIKNLKVKNEEQDKQLKEIQNFLQKQNDKNVQQVVQQEQFPPYGQVGNIHNKQICFSGHKVNFWVAPGVPQSKQFCSKCHNKKICRYICIQCRQFYCLQCLPPDIQFKDNVPFKCPGNHEMKVRPNIAYSCDICSIPGFMMPNQYPFNCHDCDFDICRTCIEKIKL